MIDLVAESAGYLKMFEAKKWDENLDYINLNFLQTFREKKLKNLRI